MLTQLRDSLLPKLMAGEIDVSGIELPTPPNNHLPVARLLCRICHTGAPHGLVSIVTAYATTSAPHTSLYPI